MKNILIIFILMLVQGCVIIKPIEHHWGYPKAIDYNNITQG